ncbi:MAG: dTMP kinase [Rickettsiales bacterium]|nr:dTMP kinase [Rickettsiales bacterium]
MSRFITFEGGEGGGKSTQIKRLSDDLSERNIEHILTREPGGSEGAEQIRELIVTGSKDRWDPKTETLLIMAARCNHIEKTIKPALKEGKWVLCDRFFDSTRIYQGISKGLGLNWLSQLHYACFGNMQPDITFLLDIDPKQGLSRAESRAGTEMRFESLPMDFHESVRAGFLEFAKSEPDRFEVIDASAEIDSIHQAIINRLKPMMHP